MRTRVGKDLFLLASIGLFKKTYIFMGFNMVELQLVVYQSEGGKNRPVSQLFFASKSNRTFDKIFFIIVFHGVIPVLSDDSFTATPVGRHVKLEFLVFKQACSSDNRDAFLCVCVRVRAH